MSFRITTEIVNGECPTCSNTTLLVNVGFGSYRCIQCGDVLEQKVNGVIKYMKVDKDTKLSMKNNGLDG